MTTKRTHRATRKTFIPVVFLFSCVGSGLNGDPVGIESASLGEARSNSDELFQQGGAALSFETQRIREDLNEFSGGVRVQVPAYRLGSHVGFLTYASQSETGAIRSLLAERNGLPFQWHRPWFARFSVANATRQNVVLGRANPVPQSGFVEYADGRRERLFNYMPWSEPEEPQARRRTSSFGEWERNGDVLVVTTSEGTRYTFGNGPCFGEGANTAGFCEATEIEDRFGNGLRVRYYGQSDTNKRNDSSTPRVLESYRRGASGLLVTGRAYFYLGSAFSGSVSLPTSEPTDVFSLPNSVWDGRRSDLLAPGNNNPGPAWVNDAARLVRAIVYPGPDSDPLTLGSDWHLTSLGYRTIKHGNVTTDGVAAPFFDWTNLTDVTTEGESHQFSYGGACRSWWVKNQSDLSMMGSLYEIALPRLSTRVRYGWGYADNSLESELVTRTVTSQQANGTPAPTLIWRMRRDDISVTQDGNNNLYRGVYTTHPTGSSTLGLFYPLARDGTVAAARTALLAERRVYDQELVTSTWNLWHYNLTGNLAQLRPLRTEHHGYATHAIGPLLLEAPAAEYWTDWSGHLDASSFIGGIYGAFMSLFTQVASSYNSGYWENTNYMGWIASPAFDAVTVGDAASTPQTTPCCMSGQVSSIASIWCRATANAVPQQLCPTGEQVFSSATNCWSASSNHPGYVCYDANFGGLSFACQDPMPGVDPYSCPNAMTPIGAAECATLGQCASVVPASAPASQTIVRMYRENNAQHHPLRPFIRYNQQFSITTSLRDDYDTFGHRPFVRQFVANGPVSIHRMRPGCTTQGRYRNGPSEYGWIFEVGDSSPAIPGPAAGYACSNDTIEAAADPDPALSQETRYRYLVEDSPKYWHGEPAFALGVRNRISRETVCALGTPVAQECEAANVRARTEYDYDNRAVAYPFANAVGGTNGASLGLTTYARRVRLDRPSESMETFYRYYDNSDVAHEPNGSAAEEATRVSDTEWRRVRQSFQDPLALQAAPAGQPTRRWVIESTGARLIQRRQYNTWNELRWEADENGFWVRYCYDSLGRLSSEFESSAGEQACPSGDADSPFARAHYWYEPVTNSVRTRARTFAGATTLAAVDSATFADALGRTILSQTQRTTSLGPRIISVASRYFASTTHATDTMLPVARTGTLGTFAGYEFAGPRTSVSYDALGREVEQSTYGNGASPVLRSNIRRGDVAADLPINVEEHRDLQGNSTQITADAWGRTVATRLPDGNTITQHYHALGSVDRVTHPDGNSSINEYDGLGRLARYVSPEAGARSVSYNRISDVVEEVEADGTRVTTRYDERGRITRHQEEWGPRTTLIRSYAYDNYPSDSSFTGSSFATGRITRAVSADGQSDYQYDVRGNIVGYRTTLTGLTRKDLTSAFDSRGRILQQHYQPGQIDEMRLRFSVDANNEIGSLERVAAVPDMLAQYTRDTLGRTTQRVLLPAFPGRQEQDIGYDDLNRVVQVNDPANLDSDAFAYRLGYQSPTLSQPRFDGLATEVEWNTRGAGRAAYVYGYDQRARVTTADFRQRANNAWSNPTSYDFAAGYNSVGAPTTLTRVNAQGVAGTTAFTYNTTSRRLASTAGAVGSSYVYDARGQLTDTSEWGANNGNNHEIGYLATGRTSYVANGQNRVDFGYDHNLQNVRIREARWQSPCPANGDPEIGGGQANACYVPKDTRWIVRAPDGTAIAEYVGQNIARLNLPELGWFAPNGNADGVPAGYYVALQDHLGSVRAVLRDNGSVVQTNDFDPYGATLSGRSTQTPGASFESFASYRQRRDMATPFFLAGARLYHPGLGRFLSPDPLAVTDAQNTSYTYALGNPVAITDPTGLQGGPPGLWMLYNAAEDLYEGGIYPLEVVISSSTKGAEAVTSAVRAARNVVDFAHATEVMYHVWQSPLREMVANGPYVNPVYAPGRVVGFVTNVGPNDAIQPMDGLNDPIFNIISLGQGGLASGRAALRETRAALRARNAVSFDASRSGHVFRNAAGHVNPGTVESQARFAQLFENVAANPGTLRTNAVASGILTSEAAHAGVEAFTWQARAGQVWVTARDGTIINAGVNRLGAWRK